MNNVAIRLAIRFFKEVKNFEADAEGRVKAPDAYKNKVMHEIDSILAGKTVTEQQLDDYITQYKKLNELAHEAYGMTDILKYFDVRARKVEVKADPNNILRSGTFYYHPALQVAPPPPMIVQLPDGTFEASYESDEFFLEIKEKFTYDDLVDYFMYRMELSESGQKERYIGQFKHILKKVDIDVLLYTIDEARALAEDLDKMKPKNPFDVMDYIEEGIVVLEERKNTCYMEGLDRVIPRGTK